MDFENGESYPTTSLVSGVVIAGAFALLLGVYVFSKKWVVQKMNNLDSIKIKVG